ncbi:MAG: hypothetical protein GYB36_11930 [Alphaproteobacteria bacterium]|nr:hypothetical protein [Alphaproteobacteria bacterium]
MSSLKMISRASLCASALGAALLSIAAPAWAQDGPESRAPVGIEVQSLEALDPMEVGLPGAALSMTMWDGSNAASARAALASLPDAATGSYPAQALSELARSVLVSGGYPPSGARGDTALAVLRADRLVAASGVYDGFDLLERTPNLNRIPELARWHAELALAAMEFDRACYTANALLDGRDAPYWLRVRAVCLALEGQSSAAELTAELAGGVEADPLFDRLLFAFTLEQGLEGEPVEVRTGLDLALVNMLTTSDPSMVQAGEATPRWLAEHMSYRRLPNFLNSSDPAGDLQRAAELTGADREFALISVLSQGMDRELAARAMSELFNDAADAGDLASALRLYGSEVSSLPQTAVTLEDGVRFALAAMAYGDLATARSWRDALIDGPRQPIANTPASPTVEDDDANKLAQPMPAEPLGQPVMDEAWTPPSPAELVALDFALLLASGELNRPGAEAVYAALFDRFGGDVLPDLLALQRLGAPVPADLRLALLEREPALVPPTLLAMDEARVAGAQTEAMLFAISALQGADALNAAEIFPRVASFLAESSRDGAMLEVLLERHLVRAF